MAEQRRDILCRVKETGQLSEALNNVLLPFRRDRLAEAVCIEAAPVALAASPSARLAESYVRQSRWEMLAFLRSSPRGKGTRGPTNPNA